VPTQVGNGSADTEYVSKNVTTCAGAADPRQDRWHIPLPGAVFAAIVWLATYAAFRVAADTGAISARPAIYLDAACFGVMDIAGIVWAIRAAAGAGDDSATRRAWMLVALAAITNFATTTLWSVREIVYHDELMPAWSNWLYSATYVFSLAGLLSFPSAPRKRAERLTFSFDVASVTITCALLFWYLCVRDNAFTAATSLSDKIFYIAFPAADLILLVAAGFLLFSAPDERARRVFRFIAFAELCGAIGDFANGYLSAAGRFSIGALPETLWMAGSVCMVLAAAQQRSSRIEQSASRPSSRWISELPFVAVGAAFIVMLLALNDAWHGMVAWVALAAILITALAIVRQRIAVHEYARLMRQRAAQDSRFRSLIQYSSDVVLVLDATLTASYASPAVARVLGRDAAAVEIRSFPDWVSERDRQFAREFLERIAATPQATDTLSCEIRHADGSLRKMEIVATNLLDDSAVLGLVLNCRDVTRRAALEEQLQHAQKLEVVGRLAGGIAHDFNNLLMVIGANAEFILGEEMDVAASREAAQEIRETTKRAAALTKQLLAFSRRQDARPVVIDPNVIVTQVERMLVRLMQHAARFAIDLAEKPHSIEIDPGQLEQALLNLAVNARDAMPNGGLFTIRTRNIALAERTRVGRGVLTPGAYVAISVEDNGSGMSEEVQRRLFEPFFTTKAIGSGTGLGLAMVLGVVQQAGGQVKVESTVGKGTTVTLYLPVARGAAVHPAARADASAMHGTGRILVVDDEEGVRTVLQRLLRRMGYEVEAVGDATTALALLSVVPLRFDLVLSDILMPGKTGLELATQLLGAGVPVAIVLMTGFADSATVREATETHRLPVLRKPFEADQLAAIVEDTLSAACAVRIPS
jgi:PAS domain S-box-containing protein